MFVKFCNNPRGNLRAGDCVIRAICAATGDTWEKIYTELSAECRRDVFNRLCRECSDDKRKNA